MKICLCAALKNGEVTDFLNVSFVDDDHEFGLSPDGTQIHIESGPLTVTRGKQYQDAPVRPTEINGMPPGSYIRAISVRRRDPAETAQRMRAAGLPGEFITEVTMGGGDR